MPRNGSRDAQPRLTGRSVIAALLAVVVIVLTLAGTLDDLPPLVRGTSQALGTLAGIYLGARWQAADQRTALEGTAAPALANLVALAGSIKLVIATTDQFRQRATSETPRTIEAFAHTSETLLAGIDNQARTLLTQVQAAAAAWVPFVNDPEAYLGRMIEGETNE